MKAYIYHITTINWWYIDVWRGPRCIDYRAFNSQQEAVDYCRQKHGVEPIIQTTPPASSLLA